MCGILQLRYEKMLLKNGVIIPLFKRGDETDLNNYRGIE